MASYCIYILYIYIFIVCDGRTKAELERKQLEFDEHVSRLQAKHVSELSSYLDLIREAEQTKDALMAEITALKVRLYIWPFYLINLIELYRWLLDNDLSSLTPCFV